MPPSEPEIYSVPLTRAEIGLVASWALENVVEGGSTYEVIVTGEKAEAHTVLSKMAGYIINPPRVFDAEHAPKPE
jgi:hypothetical protein